MIVPALAALLLSAVPPPAPAAGGRAPAATRIELSDGASAAPIASCVLEEGERAVLTWTNSLFGLAVTEVFESRSGALVLASVTFAEPGGRAPPIVRARDVDDLYQTGGAFHAEGLARPVRRVVFRVGAIGDPALEACGRLLRFADAVGFGNAIVLEARPAGTT